MVEQNDQTNYTQKERDDKIKFDLWTEPPTIWSSEIVVKTVIWFVVWWLVAAMVALIIFVVWTESLLNNAKSLLPFILIITAFFCTLFGNVMVMGAYSLFYPTKYYDFRRMFSTVLLSNWMLFFLFAIMYILMNWYQQTTIFIVQAFHISFSVFVAYTMIEFTSHPNYSASTFMWTIWWLAFAIVVYLWLYNATSFWDTNTQLYTLILFPSILSYSFIPLSHAIWTKIYYYFYSMGNNFFYMPTLQEAIKESEWESDE